MAHFVYSAFADEAATDLGEQMRCLSEEGISMLELRGVDGINCADLNEEEALSIHKKLAKQNITLSALGSPFGKIGITDPFEEHLKQFEKTLEICKILECRRQPPAPDRFFSLCTAKSPFRRTTVADSALSLAISESSMQPSSPYARFSRIVPGKKYGSCDRRSVCALNPFMSTFFACR